MARRAVASVEEHEADGRPWLALRPEWFVGAATAALAQKTSRESLASTEDTDAEVV
jgi:hypothetical protein